MPEDTRTTKLGSFFMLRKDTSLAILPFLVFLPKSEHNTFTSITIPMISVNVDLCLLDPYQYDSFTLKNEFIGNHSAYLFS